VDPAGGLNVLIARLWPQQEERTSEGQLGSLLPNGDQFVSVANCRFSFAQMQA
jgi:hypothetical protein